jgi:hypothetical protein
MDQLKPFGRERGQIETLLRDLRETEASLGRRIQQEEVRAGVANLVDPAYPMVAWKLRARRDNVLASIETLRTYQRSIVAGTET